MNLHFRVFRRRLVLLGFGFISTTMLFTSCLENEQENMEKEESAKIDNYKHKHGITESESIGDGVYMKFISGAPIDTTILKDEHTVILSYTGTLTDADEKVYETTYEQVAKSEGIYDNVIIYGPARMKTGYIIAGLKKALKLMKVGSEALVLIPSSMAWYDYVPRAYTVKLNKIIENDSIYDVQQFRAYSELQGITISDSAVKYVSKLISEPNLDTSKASIVAVDDSLIIWLKAYYAETETEFLGNKTLGRQFFPIGGIADSIKINYGDDFWFMTFGLDSVLRQMKVYETWEVIATSDYAYSNKGFKDPYYGFYIIPPYMPVHYKIELDSIIKSKTN